MPPELDPAIAAHYAHGVERDRLTTWDRLEAERTRELLARLLPAAPATILDVGGARGADALPLAAAGSGGVVIAAAISRFASTFDGLRSGAMADPAFEAIVEADLRDGVHVNPDPEGRPEWFTLAYFHRPEELAAELRAAGFQQVHVLAVEGPGAWLADADGWLDDPARREALLRAIRRVEAEPAIAAASAHFVAVGHVF